MSRRPARSGRQGNRMLERRQKDGGSFTPFVLRGCPERVGERENGRALFRSADCEIGTPTLRYDRPGRVVRYLAMGLSGPICSSRQNLFDC
jgi:hypothetical protein